MAHRDDERAAAHIYRRRSGGLWQVLGGGLPEPLDSFPYALAMHSRTLFAGLRDGRICRSDDPGKHWLQLSIHGDAPPRIPALAPLNRMAQ